MTLLRRARRNKQLVTGVILAVVIAALGIVGPWIFGAYDKQDLLAGHKPLGTQATFLVLMR